MLKFGVIGYGYWGPNVVRNLMSIEGSRVVCVCDMNVQALKKVGEIYPSVNICSDHMDVFRSKDVDAVAIVTPVSTHYELARTALENGKHIFVEKPFTTSSAHAEELIKLAEKKNLKIMVDHTFLFTGAVQKMKELIDRGELGDLYYYDSTRVSLGLFQQDVNVIWDLAPHDFSIIDHLIKEKPLALTAHGMDHTGSGKENLAYINLYFESKLLVHINVNWLSPVKIRSTLIGGQKKMLVWDDLKTDEKIRVYDRGVTVESREGMYRMMVDYRSGDMWSPKVDHAEALKKELAYFADCIRNNETPFNDGPCGLRVVRLLECADQSLKGNGKIVKI